MVASLNKWSFSSRLLEFVDKYQSNEQQKEFTACILGRIEEAGERSVEICWGTTTPSMLSSTKLQELPIWLGTRSTIWHLLVPGFPHLLVSGIIEGNLAIGQKKIGKRTQMQLCEISTDLNMGRLWIGRGINPAPPPPSVMCAFTLWIQHFYDFPWNFLCSEKRFPCNPILF